MDELLFFVLSAVGGRLIARNFDRNRIRECIESCGGKLLDIAFNPTGNRLLGDDRTYDVRYETPEGKVCEATCKTSMFEGVDWIATVPPGLSAHQPQQNAYGSDETITCLQRGASIPEETISCLQCRASIPAGHSHCDNCGWSYTAG